MGSPRTGILASSRSVRCLPIYLLCLVIRVGWAQTDGPASPNIVLILANDLGWTDTGFSGSRFYETPNLDTLSSNGIRFTSFYTAPNGVPTRASILSGQYAPRTGVYTTGSLERGDPAARKMVPPPNQTNLPSSLITIASVLKNAGYVTGFLGDWGLATNQGNHPEQRGFDEALLASGKHLGFVTDPPSEVPEGTYLADFLTDKAVDFITRHQSERFFLYLSHFAVHSPYEAKPALVSHFEKKAPGGGHRDATYAAMLASFDESIGRVVGKLDELQLGGRTVIIFLSANGGVGGYVDLENGGRRSGITDNAPLRGGKGMLYEGGIRVPCLIRWRGVTQAASRTTQPCVHVDLFPTLCEIAGVRPPAVQALDGVSLVPLLRDPGGHLGRDAIYWHFPGYIEAYGRAGWRMTPGGAIRAGNFKLVEFFEDDRAELYNLVEDIGEKSNLVRSLPEKAAELRAKLATWRKDIGAALPGTNSVNSADAGTARPRP